MNSIKPAALLFLLFLLIFAGCLPPWQGEECNYPVVKVNFWDAANYHLGSSLPLDTVGVSRLYHVERAEEIPLTGWEAEPNMRFARYDPLRELLLPLDVEATQSTIVMERPGRSDTIFLRYNSRLGMVDNCGYSYLVEDLEVSASDSLQVNEGAPRHPRVIGVVEVIL